MLVVSLLVAHNKTNWVILAVCYRYAAPVHIKNSGSWSTYAGGLSALCQNLVMKEPAGGLL